MTRLIYNADNYVDGGVLQCDDGGIFKGDEKKKKKKKKKRH